MKRILVIDDDLETCNFLTIASQPLRKVIANKPGRTGHEYFTHARD